MSNPSNLYAEKIFSEHPLALWPMDESVDYLSLIDETKRDLAGESWERSNCIVEENNLLTSPKNQQEVFSISSNSLSFEIEGENLVNEYVNEELESVDIGFYLYPVSDNIKSIKFGYKYDGNGVPRYTNSQEYLYEIPKIDRNRWTFVSRSFPLPTKEQIFIRSNNESISIVNKSLTSNVATLTTSRNHNIQIGQTVYVANVDSTFDGNYEVTGVTADTFSYALVSENVSSVVTGGSVNYLDLDRTDNTLIISSGQPTKISLEDHGFVDGNRVKLDADFDLPAGLNKYSYYFIVNADDNTFEIEEDLGSGSLTFSYPDFGTMYVNIVKTITPFIRFESFFEQESVANVSSFSMGQWSQEFFDQSDGVLVSELPNINIGREYYGISSDVYGLQELPAYYLSRENRLLAKNINMPMLYGSSHVTSLLPERFGGPSFIFPGKGFLNEYGRYRTYTVEFWLRISPDTQEPRRIFGPINSEDGLYVDGPFVTLKIGNGIQSHYVGEWYRPMLVNIIYFQNGASLIINGEKVIDISFSSQDLDLPQELSLANREQDWLGFYSYSDIYKFEIDCVAIYSYRVPSAVSKRRWVYGQAVDFPEETVSAYSGQSFVVDYTLSKYSNNYTYPDIASWSQGSSENISTQNNVLGAPAYSLPEIIFDNKTSENWTRSLSSIYSNVITLKPDSSWQDTNGYLFFNRTNILSQKTAGFYAVFEAPINYSATSQTLFRLENKISGNYLDVSLKSESKNVQSVSEYSISGNSFFVVNINSHGLLDGDIVSFLGSLPTGGDIEIPSELISKKEYYVYVIDNNSFYITDTKNSVSGSSTGTLVGSSETPSLKLFVNHIDYQLFFNSQNTLVYRTPAITTGHSFVAGINFKDFADHFGGNVSTFIKNIRQLSLYVGGNKTFTNTFDGNIYRIGFCTRKNLEELNYLFAENGLPFLRYQFDGGEDVSNSWIPSEIVNAGYVYEDYVEDILSHVASYTLAVKNFFGERYLDIETSSQWQDYVPLSYFAKNVTNTSGKKEYFVDFVQINANTIIPQTYDEEFYDLDNSDIRMYVSLQTISGGPVFSEDSFEETERISRSRIIEPGDEWLYTKYEVVNGSIIYIPKNIDISNTALVVHVSIKSRGIIKNPTRVRSLQLASRSLDSLVPNPVVTKFGVSAFPYTKYDFYYDYKAKNPYIIYKDSTPYLYLTKNSGIELTGDFDGPDRGVALIVNRERSNNYYLSSVQFSMKFSRNDLVESDIKIIELEGKNPDDYITVWMAPANPSEKRFTLYAKNSRNEILSNVEFYLNGLKTSSPTITTEEWNMIGIGLLNPIDISQASGRINFVGPIMFNNVSYYSLNALQRATIDLFGNTEYFGVDLVNLYKVFTGTNKEIVSDDVRLAPQEYRYAVFNNTEIQSATIRPV
jgi:hypothetical protein